MSVISSTPTLYERLPEIYRQRDLDQTPREPLRAFVDAIDSVLQNLKQNQNDKTFLNNLLI